MAETGLPAVTIAVASYGGGVRLARLFASLGEAGAGPEDELLVWDDGTPEGGAAGAGAVREAFASAPVAAKHLYRSAERKGWPIGHAHLLERASCPAVLWLDDDVVLPAGFFDVARELLARIPNVGALSWRTRGPKDSEWNSRAEVPGLLELATNLAGTCTLFWRSVADKVGGIDCTFEFAFADSDLPLRMTLAGHPSYRVWWPLVWHEEGASARESPELPRPPEVAARDRKVWDDKWGKSPEEMQEAAIARLFERAAR